ncbi:glycosyltransferase [Actinomadura yumaensis]|uniref:glycosyltransferase n=1 Tax=Actinomadura yumaensis TaxID=111807 RepID=UPI003613119A
MRARQPARGARGTRRRRRRRAERVRRRPRGRARPAGARRHRPHPPRRAGPAGTGGVRAGRGRRACPGGARAGGAEGRAAAVDPGLRRAPRAPLGSAPPDVVHAHFWMSGLAALQAAEIVANAGAGRNGRGRIPVVQTYHALGTVKRRFQGDQDTSPPGRIRLERAIGRGADAVIATCTDEVAELTAMGVPPDRVAIVPCGVDVERFRPDGPEGPDGARPAGGRDGAPHRIVVLSRMVERKGVDTAIEALAGVPGAELVAAGGPPRDALGADPEMARLAAVARAAGVADRVAFTGRVGRADAPGLLRSADLVVTLPWYEPFGMVPLEAMACGAPVVATGVGGHLDTVVDGITGAHVRPRDPREAADRIRALLADPVLRAGMGSAGAARARSRYSWERVARDTLAVYASVAVPQGVAA